MDSSQTKGVDNLPETACNLSLRIPMAPGRRTRSGNEFSPYMLPPGPPIRVETVFDIAQALSDLNAVRMAREDDGLESEDEREIEIEGPPPPRMSTSPSASASKDTPPAPQPSYPSKPSSTPTKLRPELTHKQRHSKESRARRRSAKQQLLPPDLRQLKSIALKKRKNLEAIPIPADVEEFCAASTGWIGVKVPNDERTFTLEEVTGAPYNLRHVQWDGRTPRPIVDAKDRVIAALAGQPDDSQWDDVSDSAAEDVRQAGDVCSFNDEQSEHRRGQFPALATGVSFGGGQKVAGNLLNSTINALALASLLASASIQRFAGFASVAFNLFAPKLYVYYVIELGKLFDSNPLLRRNFKKSPWPAATFNFGPWTITFPHTDPGNLAFGWCAIAALGKFDFRRGGQIILWDLGLVIDFPPGSSILIPSAVIRHSNTIIQTSETRYSFTQYAAGGLFRWVRNGFCSDKTFVAKATKKQMRQREEARQRRWKDGVGMFSKLEELSA